MVTLDPEKNSSHEPQPKPFVKRLRVRNYRSIGACNIELRPLSVLVGRNAAGKSNVLDSLRFVRDALETSPSRAIHGRGGLAGVIRLDGSASPFEIGLELHSPVAGACVYEIEISPTSSGIGSVTRERFSSGELQYEICDGVFTERSTPQLTTLPILNDRLFLATASTVPGLSAHYDAMSRMGFYHFIPALMKSPRRPGVSTMLSPDGTNLPEVIRRLRAEEPDLWQRIIEYLGVVIPGDVQIDVIELSDWLTLQFKQRINGPNPAQLLSIANVSDGTLCVLATLVAALHALPNRTYPTLVGIEEPESALHPAAAGVLMDAFREAALRTQVVLTTHNQDLLDRLDIDSDALLVVEWRAGETHVAPADTASVSAIHDHLFTAGELLRLDQLQPDDSHVASQRNGGLTSTDELAK